MGNRNSRYVSHYDCFPLVGSEHKPRNAEV
nr:MAG TPA: hypothetical protein [Caudoviricetes sp.]